MTSLINNRNLYFVKNLSLISSKKLICYYVDFTNQTNLLTKRFKFRIFNCIKMVLTPTDVVRAVALVQVGRNQQVGINHYAVQRSIQQFSQTEKYTRRPGSYRRKATSARNDGFLVFSCLRNRHLTSVELANRLNKIRYVDVSRWTVRRRLNEANLSSTREDQPYIHCYPWNITELDLLLQKNPKTGIAQIGVTFCSRMSSGFVQSRSNLENTRRIICPMQYC